MILLDHQSIRLLKQHPYSALSNRNFNINRNIQVVVHPDIEYKDSVLKEEISILSLGLYRDIFLQSRYIECTKNFNNPSVIGYLKIFKRGEFHYTEIFNHICDRKKLTYMNRVNNVIKFINTRYAEKFRNVEREIKRSKTYYYKPFLRYVNIGLKTRSKAYVNKQGIVFALPFIFYF